jgi:dynein heavy chain
VPLFEGIISDLFPGVQSPQPDFGVFLEALKENIAKHNLQPVPWFIEKIIQVVLRSTQLNFISLTTREFRFET